MCFCPVFHLVGNNQPSVLKSGPGRLQFHKIWKWDESADMLSIHFIPATVVLIGEGIRESDNKGKKMDRVMASVSFSNSCFSLAVTNSERRKFPLAWLGTSPPLRHW